MSIAPQFRAIRTELNEAFPQRKDAVDAIVLATLSGEHAFLLGPPGTAKSLLVRSFTERLTGVKYFETVLSKNRPDAAILGPYNLQLLRDESKFVRKDEGFLTTAQIAFLDEVGKMSPTSGHDILAALNERVKHEVDNGRSAHHIPLHTVIGASNELPAAESEDAAALWDRLLFRAEVGYLTRARDFKAMLTGSTERQGATTVPFEEVLVAAKEVSQIPLSKETMDGVLALRERLRKDGVIVSDRRWRLSMKGVQASAWLREAAETGVDDLETLRLTLWDDVERRAKIQRTIFGSMSAELEMLDELADTMAELEQQLAAMAGKSASSLADFFSQEASGKLQTLKRHLTKARKNASSTRELDMIEDIEARMDTFRKEAIAQSNLGAIFGDS